MIAKSVPARKKLLHIVGDSKFGGGSVIILRLAEMAAAAGYETDVLTTDSVFQTALAQRQIGIVNEDFIWRSIRPVRDLAGLIKLWRFLSRNRYDIVHTHTSKAGFVGRIAAWLARVPHIVHTVHGFAFHEESSAVAVIAYSLIERIAAHFCQRIVTVSHFHRTWALKLGIGSTRKVVAIPNGLQWNRVLADKDRESARRELGINNGTLMLLSTGRLAAQKGIEYLLRAVPALSRQLSIPFKLVLVGTGPLQAELEALVSELRIEPLVQFTGFRTDLGNLLIASDIVVLPSLREGLSISLLEAMAAGKPIVATSIGSNLEVTQTGRVAFLVPPRDPDAIVAAIVDIVARPGMAAVRAANAKETFFKGYTEELMLDAYEELYKQMLEGRAATRWIERRRKRADRELTTTADARG